MPPDPTDPAASETAWLAGNRAAYASMLRECIRALGYDSLEATATRWIAEREGAIAKLREICARHGDNEWDESLHLADVLEKHLERHLEE